MEVGFPEALLTVGILLAAASALSGFTGGTILSISVLSVAAGIGLALTGVIDVAPDDTGLIELIELALILTLLADGLMVERELLRRAWRPPFRALAVALPLTILILGAGAKLLFGGLSWVEALLLGAVLAPTDPVVTSSLVASPGVPNDIKHTLNLESGLNDGLALPIVLLLLILAAPGGDAGGEALRLLGEATAAVVIGGLAGYFGGRLLAWMPREPAHRYESLYALGVGLIVYGISDLTIANGLVAVFVCGIALGSTKEDLPVAFVPFNENLSAIFEVLTFFVFGALIVGTGYGGSIPALLAFIVFALVIARPAAIMVAFVGTLMRREGRAFIAWFGPKGVASMLFALFVLRSHAPARSVEFEIASFVILASIIAHGATDSFGVRWISSRIKGPSAKVETGAETESEAEVEGEAG